MLLQRVTLISATADDRSLGGAAALLSRPEPAVVELVCGKVSERGVEETKGWGQAKGKRVLRTDLRGYMEKEVYENVFLRKDFCVAG